MPYRVIYRTIPTLTRSTDRRPVLCGDWFRAAATVLACCVISACSLPISVPLSPLAGPAAPAGTTQTASTEVVDSGVAERIGAKAWVALSSALVSAVERGEDGQAFTWKSAGPTDEWSTEGTVTALDAFFDEDGDVCRRLAITAVAYRRTDAFSAEACRREGGGWDVRALSGEA